MNSKPFFIVLVIILFFAILMGGALDDVDLTPDNGTTTGTSAGTTDTSGGTVNYSVFGGSTTSGAASGPCGSVYTVQSGDTLSQIAKKCEVELKDLVAVNPNIADPNLIYPNQQINIAGAAAIATAVSIPTATAVIIPTAAPISTSVPAQPTATTPSESAPASGLRAGGSVPVRLNGFPANTIVQVGIGKADVDPTIVAEGLTDEAGTFIMEVVIPRSAKAGERWKVTVSTETQPYVEKETPVFVIVQ